LALVITQAASHTVALGSRLTIWREAIDFETILSVITFPLALAANSPFQGLSAGRR
jgi:hypothetical protein